MNSRKLVFIILYVFIFFFATRLVFSNPTIAYYVETSGGTGDGPGVNK